MAGLNWQPSGSSLVEAFRLRVSLGVSGFIALLLLVSQLGMPRAFAAGASYLPDCNDPDAHEIACVEPTKALIEQLYNEGYPYYIGHAEPTTEFFSTAGLSGSNMKWKFVLPATDPAPTQNGSSVANFELYVALWMGLDLCDPNSFPYGSCVADSDTNNPATAGSGFLELQFYPPGLNLSSTQWSVRLHINTFENNTPTQVMNCEEPTTEAYVTTNGMVGGTALLMNTGDTIIVTIHDTVNGLETDVDDVTTATTGFMVASAANGFVHNANTTDCTTTGFDFHPMFQTAAPGQVVPWATLGPNVAFDFEIGHFELCGDAACSTLPDGTDSDDVGCMTVRGIGGCFGSDLDHDGTPYLADWANGSASFPGSLVLGNATDNGVGPLSTSASSPGTYVQPYGTIKFATTEATTGSFYPFWSQAGTGTSCRFNFGNDIPSTTTNDFGQRAQYGTTITNPCGPPSFILNSEKVQIARSTSSSNADLVNLGLTFTDNGIASTCNSGNDALTSGIMASLFAGSCLDLMGSGLLLDLDPFAIHMVDGQSYGTFYQSDPPDTLQQSGETIAARIVTQPTPGGACGKWILNVEVGGLDTTTLGLGGGNPFALMLTDADAAFGCFDIDNAIVGNQLDPPRKVRRGARRGRR